MTTDDILRITRPEAIFPGDVEQAHKKYRTLARVWHPDVATGDTNVFAHISKLFHQAIEKLKNGTWEGAASVTFETESGTRSFDVLASAPFELGQSLVAEHGALWLVDAPHAKLVSNALLAPTCFTFANAKMETEFMRYLPSFVGTRVAGSLQYLVTSGKTPDLIRLRDVVTHTGPLDPRHVAWIVSSLMNLACYLSYTGLTHNDISQDTYFISPKHHSGALLGGWWYSARRGGKLSQVPRRTFDVLPFSVRRDKVASSRTDMELIRLTAREILGPGAPKPMLSWLDKINAAPAREQYAEWNKVLDTSFGPRKFVPLDVDAIAVYGQQETKS